MNVVNTRCCGLDVHLKTVVACVLMTQDDGTVVRKTHTFKTMTEELLALRDWLDHWGVTHVAMESTGVYWRPVYNVLEDEGRTLLLVNAQHIKAVPGRKTDVKDAEWLADLLRHGLLAPSFIPPDRPPAHPCGTKHPSRRVTSGHVAPLCHMLWLPLQKS